MLSFPVALSFPVQVICALLLFSHPVVSDSLQLHGLQHVRPPVPHHLLKFAPVHVHCISDAIQSSHPLMLSSPFTLNLSLPQGLFQWVSYLHQMIKILELQLQHQSFQWVFRVDFPQHWLVWSPCCPWSFQESSLAPQFESINSLAFWFLYSPAITTAHDHWEDHSLDYADLCW